MERGYIVMEIGCLECLVPSGIVGVFHDREEAVRVARDCQDRCHWRCGGENTFAVFALPTEWDQVAEEYRATD